MAASQPSPSPSPSPSRRRSTVSSKSSLQRQDRDPGLLLFWEGRFVDAEAKLASKIITGREELAYVRMAQCQVARALLTGDRKLPGDCVARLVAAESKCNEGSARLVEQLRPGMERHAARSMTVMRRLSRRASVTVPIAAKMGLVTRYNPGELTMADAEFQVEKKYLNEWRNLQGLAAWCCMLRMACLFMTESYVKCGFCVRRAFSIVKQASLNSEFETMEPCPLHLVIGALQLLYSNIPANLLPFLKITGFISDQEKGMQLLEHCLRADPNSETHNFARLLLATHFLLLSQQEYRSDRSENLKKAENLLLDVLEGNNVDGNSSGSTRSATGQQGKDWILYRWLHTHVQRRMGNIDIACQEISLICPILEQDLFSMRSATNAFNVAVVNYRLRFDLGMLNFVKGDYPKAIECILPLVSETSRFSGGILGCAVLSSCYAMLNDNVSAEKWLDFMDKFETSKEKTERSIHVWKLDTLLKRPHKSLLAYELLYLYGFMRNFDVRTAGSAVAVVSGNSAENSRWVARTFKELKALNEFAAVSVVYPEFPATTYTATEEFMTSSLLCGAMSFVMGDLEQAEKFLNGVVNNKSNKQVGSFDDPYMAPFALFELAAIAIRKREFPKARAHLARTLKKCKKRNFSFHHMLSYKCVGAARYINEILGEKVADPTDTLTTTYLGPGVGFAMPDDGEDDENEAGNSASDKKKKKQTVTSPSAASASGSKKSEGMTIGHQDGLSELQMIAVSVGAGACVSVPHQMKPFATASWQFTVQTHDIDSKVEFFAASKTQDTKEAIVVAEIDRHEAGEFVEGFYLSQTAGTLIITFDNTFSMFTPKVVHYYIE